MRVKRRGIEGIERERERESVCVCVKVCKLLAHKHKCRPGCSNPTSSLYYLSSLSRDWERVRVWPRTHTHTHTPSLLIWHTHTSTSRSVFQCVLVVTCEATPGPVSGRASSHSRLGQHLPPSSELHFSTFSISLSVFSYFKRKMLLQSK